MRFKCTFGLLPLLLFSCSLSAATGSARLPEAAKNQDLSAVRSLLKQGHTIDLNATDSEEMTALNWAAYHDDLEMVKLLLASGAKVDIPNRFGGTPLHQASTFGDVWMMEALIKAGADPNAARGEGDTPLMIVAHTGNADAASLLLARGAKVDARDGWLGETALMIAVAEDYPNVAKVLIDHGADVDAYSTKFNFVHRRLVDATLTIDPVMGGLTPLLFAARQGAVSTGQVLIAAGASVNAPDPEYKFTPLLLAIMNNHFDFAKLLIQHGADVNDGSLTILIAMRDGSDGYRLLSPTFKQDGLAVAKLLIERGAKVDAPFVKRMPPFTPNTGRKMIFPGTAPFYAAAQGLDLPMMHLLLENGAKANVTLRDGSTPLMALMNFGAAGLGGGDDVFPPNAALAEAMQLCLDHGVDVNAANTVGVTALHYAAGRGNDFAVEYLVDHGAALEVRNKKGRTPLQWAQGMRPGGLGNLEETGQAPHDSTIALLKRLEAGPNAQNSQKRSPL